VRTGEASRVITVPSSSSMRNHRNNPYVLDRMFVQVHHSAAGTLFRFRTELATLSAAIGGGWELARLMTVAWMVVIYISTLGAITVLPWTRRFVIRRAWCVLSRHRIQKVCYETRMHTRSGRLPLVLRIHPTQVGERALIWCRAGICKADFEAHAEEIAAACYARQARVNGHKRWAQLVHVDIVRHDTLAPHHVIPSGLPGTPPQWRQAS
jgi:hypothetical protein